MTTKQLVVIVLTAFVGAFFVMSIIVGFPKSEPNPIGGGSNIFTGWPLTYNQSYAEINGEYGPHFDIINCIIDYFIYFILLLVILYFILNKKSLLNQVPPKFRLFWTSYLFIFIIFIAYFILNLFIPIRDSFHYNQLGLNIEAYFSPLDIFLRPDSRLHWENYWNYHINILAIFILLSVVYFGYYLARLTGAKIIIKSKIETDIKVGGEPKRMKHYLVIAAFSGVCLLSIAAYLIFVNRAPIQFVQENYCEKIKQGSYECTYGWGTQCGCVLKYKDANKPCLNSTQCSEGKCLAYGAQVDYIYNKYKIFYQRNSCDFPSVGDIKLPENISKEGICQTFPVDNFNFDWEINDGVITVLAVCMIQ